MICGATEIVGCARAQRDKGSTSTRALAGSTPTAFNLSQQSSAGIAGGSYFPLSCPFVCNATLTAGSLRPLGRRPDPPSWYKNLVAGATRCGRVIAILDVSAAQFSLSFEFV